MSELSNEYGTGLFMAARRAENTREILAESRELSRLITKDYIGLLSNPDIPKTERVSLVSELLDGRVQPYLANFVKLLTERGIVAEIFDCFAEYERLYYEHHEIVRVKAESAVELSAAQRQKLYERLKSRTGHEVEIEYVVRPEALGGMKLSYDNRLIDSTIKSKLGELGARLSDTVI